MDRMQVLAKKNSRLSYYIVLAIMCFAIFLAIEAAVNNNIVRNEFAFSNTIVDIVCLFFALLLFGFSFSKAGDKKKPALAFKVLVTLVFATIFFSALANSIYGIPERYILLNLFVTLSYIVSGTFYLALWGYQKQFIKNSKMTLTVTVLITSVMLSYIAAVIINLFMPVTFIITPQGLYDETVFDLASFMMNCFCLTTLCIATFNSGMNLKKKLSFTSFLLVPAIHTVLILLYIVLGWDIILTSITSAAMILTLYIIFFNIHIEMENEIIHQEKEQIRLQFSAMISQIQPHFVYNSLSVIAALCEEDPGLAAEAANTFSDYLRKNIDFANKNNPVSFPEELNHIKTYIWLEQLRFPNKLKAEYDIRCTDFYVPALSVQPLAENAVKHGICKTKSGGTVRISSFEDDLYYVITVTDDGAGFDASKPVQDGKQHVGIENARFRIREMFNGSLDIESRPGDGTTVTIKIPKRK